VLQSFSLASCICKGFRQIRDVGFLLFASHDYVIDVRQNIVADLILQSCLHHSTECWPGIAETFGYSEIAKSAEGGDEVGLLFTPFVEPYLVVYRETIQQHHHLVTYGGIDDFINSREGEVIFWASLVQVCKIRAHSPFIIFLPYHYVICQPLRVDHLPDETCVQQSFVLGLRNFYFLF
jgi:hypothetical protein